MLLRRIALLLITLLSLSMVLTGCSVFHTPEQELDTYLENLIRNKQSPSLSVLVIKEGKTVYKKSFGYANVQTKEKATPASNYRLASLTKMHTAMCAIILHEKGLLDYEAKVSSILPDFPLYGKDITVRHLLTHTSGLKDYYGDPVDLLNRSFDKDHQLQDADVYEIVKRLDGTYFIPGSTYRYSDTGYTVLGQIIEKVSHQSLASFMKENIFEPAHMTQTIAYVQSSGIPVENRVYGSGTTGSKFIINDQSYSSAVIGDGGVYSSLNDLEAYDQALYTDSIVSQSALQEAYKTQTDFGTVAYHPYRFGWFFKENRTAIIEQYHDGSTQGFSTYYLRQPDSHNAIVVLSNKTMDIPAYQLHQLIRRLYGFEQHF